MAMIKNQGSPRKKHIRVGQGDHSTRGGFDWSSNGLRNVYTKMWPAGLTIQDALAAIDSRYFSDDRPDETILKIRTRRIQHSGSFR